MRWLAGLAFTSIALAQVQSGEIRVHVVDPSGLPLPATVSIVSEGSHTHREAKSVADTNFLHLPFGVYQIRVEDPGFKAFTTTVDLRSPVPKQLRVQLALGETQTSVEVSAGGTLVDPDETGTKYAVGSQQLQEAMSTVPGRAVLESINEQPGWIFEANGVLHPRGSEYQTQFVVDGMPLEENRSPAFAPAFDAQNVAEMSVMTGNIPAEYGRKLGGVIEVTTARDATQGLHGQAGLGGGSFDTESAFASLTYGAGRNTFSVDGQGDRTDRYLDPPVLENFTNSGTSASGGAGYSVDLTTADRISVSGRWAQSRFEVPNERVQQTAGQRQDRTTPEVEGRAAWTHILSPSAVLSVRGSAEDLGATLWSNALATPIIAAQDRGFRRTYINSTVALQKARYDLKFGADAFYSPVHERLRYAITDPSYFDGDTTPVFAFEDSRLDREQAAFAQGTARWGNFNLSAGLRFDHYSFAVRDHAFSPRLGVSYYAKPLGLLLRFSYDRVFQTPAIENLLLASSAAVDQISGAVLRLPVRPSRGDYFDAGFTKSIAGKARLDATWYRRTFKNYADDDVFLNTGISFPISFASSWIEGVDVKLDLPHWGGLGGSLSYSNLHGTARLPVTGGLFLGDGAASLLGAQSSFPITQDQRNTARGRVRYEITKRAWAALDAQYGSGLPVEIDNPDLAYLTAQYGERILRRVNFDAGRVRPNFSLDVNAGYVLWQREKNAVRIEGEIDNLTGRVNVIDFAGVFSGTAVGVPRSGTLRLTFGF